MAADRSRIDDLRRRVQNGVPAAHACAVGCQSDPALTEFRDWLVGIWADRDERARVGWSASAKVGLLCDPTSQHWLDGPRPRTVPADESRNAPY